MTTVRVPCEACSGRGVIPRFAHVADGICFSCEGRGYELADLEALEAADARRAAAAVERDARIVADNRARQTAGLERFAAGYPAHAEILRVAFEGGLPAAADLLEYLGELSPDVLEHLVAQDPPLSPLAKIEALRAAAFSVGDVDLAVRLRDLALEASADRN